MRIVVGLGNPGSEYSDTRHNVGFRVIDRLQKEYSASDFFTRWSAHVSGVRLEPQAVMLVKPQTYMNLSGESVLEMLEDLEEEPGLEDLLVVTDDAALPLGSMRFRPRGSCGGHNGLASIEQSLASDGYPRLRIGVGPATEGIPLKEFVLGGFSEREEDMLSSVIPTAAKAVRLWVEEGIEACQREYNGWRFEPGDSENAEPDPETRNPDTEE